MDEKHGGDASVKPFREDEVAELLAAGEKVRAEMRRELAPLREVEESDLRLRLD